MGRFCEEADGQLCVFLMGEEVLDLEVPLGSA